MRGEKGVAWVLWGMMALIFVLAACSTLSPSVCDASVFTEALAKREATWCAEFWLNRYQVLLGATFAIAGAWAAWRIGMKQLRTANEGLAIARRQSAASVLDHLIARRELIENAISVAKNCEDAVRKIDCRSVRRTLSELKHAHARGQGAPEDKILAVAEAVNKLGISAARIDSVARAAEELARGPAITERMGAALTRQAVRARKIASNAVQLANSMKWIPDEAHREVYLFTTGGGDFLSEIDNLSVEVESGDGGVSVDLHQELARLQYLIEVTIKQIEGSPA
jgi:predicted nucleic acid-binding protein